ncbi:Holliday junction endonuclease RuvC [Hydrogenispora ethanolica]|uniref:Crossover junction endodeoxyribonuclease RuvC n=1 Tax=Hydrogenispora ethanolica TaxID=1082276 RepID=A0A4R1R919_HYDET|nr:crossover junction endodeoxyribonuclease RuvC [Hydrogenispora ethanolica]TCL62181.1 Holliday junction endonuclease RuvC [Hydrogenispora ethanolica]
MIILGIDPGTAITGFGVIAHEGNHLRRITYGVVRTEAGLALASRLSRIYRQIQTIIQEYRPEVVAVEELFFNKNVRTALAVGQARGVILLAAETAGLETVEYTPLQVKQAVVGYGRAEKQQVQEMVRMLLCLPEIPKPDDAADALAIAICHAHSRKLSKVCY